MQEQKFLPTRRYEALPERGNATWQSPSNIALVKYWGKKEHQIPANPSISLTLENCRSITSLEFEKRKDPGKGIDFEFLFEGHPREDFRPKLLTFFERIIRYCPFLTEYFFRINSENSFPHSSGIASSASGMSALALCLMSQEKELMPSMTDQYFYQKASFLARLGSGSACRSIAGGLVHWGEHQGTPGSSDLYGFPYPGEVDEVFLAYQDTILLVDKGRKPVSSSVGHDLMHDHPLASGRFRQAHRNLDRLQPIFASGNLKEFITIVESEALSLHAMMMSSDPYFILMKPATLEIINRIWDYRSRTGLPVCFTLDAGANVHVLYPSREKKKVMEFIKNELVVYCEKGQYICDSVGKGAKKL